MAQIPNRSLKVLTVSEALAQAAQHDLDLAPYYEFHRTLFDLQEKAKKEITATLELADQEALQTRVLQGLSAISFAQLPIEAERFAGLSAAIAQRLGDYYASEGMGGELPTDMAEWVSLARRRFEEGQANLEQGGKTATLLAEIAVDQALRPYLAWAAEQVLPHLDQQQWLRSYCPVCGGSPDFAFLAEESGGARYLVCSRCNSQWLYRRLGCPFCDADDRASTVYYPSEDEVYRLYVCQACRRYLKTMDLRRTGGGLVRVEVERVTTVSMDAAARQEGYQ
jgi:formate dehydrogenase maturation protein FdhE